MPKKINGLRIVYIIISLLVIGAGLVVTFTLQGASIATTSTKIVELKDEGCAPANENDRRLIKIETQMGAMLEGQKEILKAVKEK